MPAPVRILLADDHPVVREGLAAILGTEPDFDVVATVGTGPEAVAHAEELRPDVAVLDLEMPGGGVEATRAVRERVPGCAVVVFTAFDRDEQIIAALKAGATGYLLKGAPRDELFRAIRAAHAGGSLIEPVVASKLLRRVRGNESALTPREADVLRAIAQGLPNKRIATELGMSERTVKFHVASLLRKLDAANRTEAVARARNRGLL
jgi:DNA-binding NarL/FixJ family response regulator